MAYLENLMAAESAAIAPASALTNLAPDTAVPGWLQKIRFNTQDGTCNVAHTAYQLFPIGYCWKGGTEGYQRYKCSGTTLSTDKFDDTFWNMCSDDSESKKCDVSLAKSDVKALDTCQPESFDSEEQFGGDTCVPVDLADADDKWACSALCQAVANDACKKVAYNAVSKECIGYPSSSNTVSCDDGEDADGFIKFETSTHDVKWQNGCSSADPLPGGVISFYGIQDTAKATALDAADCTTFEEKDDDEDPYGLAEEVFFIFDKCQQKDDTKSVATYCVNDEVIHSVWDSSLVCNGDPTSSYKLTNTCVLESQNSPVKSLRATWWGACGVTGGIPVADTTHKVGGAGVDDTCTPPTPIDPACTCESGVGKPDGVWTDGDTCGAIVGENGCADVKTHFSTASASDAALWESTCCGESSAAALTALFAAVAGLVFAAVGL